MQSLFCSFWYIVLAPQPASTSGPPTLSENTNTVIFSLSLPSLSKRLPENFVWNKAGREELAETQHLQSTNKRIRASTERSSHTSRPWLFWRSLSCRRWLRGGELVAWSRPRSGLTHNPQRFCGLPTRPGCWQMVRGRSFGLLLSARCVQALCTCE